MQRASFPSPVFTGEGAGGEGKKVLGNLRNVSYKMTLTNYCTNPKLDIVQEIEKDDDNHHYSLLLQPN